MQKHYSPATRLVLALVAFSIQPMTWAFVTVGTGPDCDYDNLFPAYNDSDPEIRVTSEQVHTNNFTIEKIKVFKGGYDSCQDAENNIPGSQKSRWSGLNTPDNTVVTINANLIILSTVIIDNFEIYAGNNNTFANGGGIHVAGNSNLILTNSIIRDNQGNEGGGIHVSGSDARLNLENTVVQDNQASGFGGGIYCSHGARVTMDAVSSVFQNTANNNGGGLFGGQDCQITSASGQTVMNRQAFGISDNEASQGGGIYLQAGADIEVSGSLTQPAIITGNLSTELSEPGGGGIFLTGSGTEATLTNTHLTVNDASSHGAAMVVTDQATFNMQQADSGCLFGANTQCSLINSNWGTLEQASGGAGYFRDGANVNIAQTAISFNRSAQVAGFDLHNGVTLRLEGNLIRNNRSILNGSASPTLFRIDGAQNQASEINFGFNTVVFNDVTHFFTANNLNSTQKVNVFNSLIWDFGTIFNFNGPAMSQIDCSVVHESASLSGNVGAILTNDPLFVNEAAGNFRLSLASDAIDFCDNNLFPDQHRDLVNTPRGIDTPTVNNAFGTYDAGAYEYEPETIFNNGFE